MNLLIRLTNKGIKETTKQWTIPTRVDKATAQEIVNRDFSMFIEGKGNKVEIIGEITPLEEELN